MHDIVGILHRAAAKREEADVVVDKSGSKVKTS